MNSSRGEQPDYLPWWNHDNEQAVHAPMVHVAVADVCVDAEIC